MMGVLQKCRLPGCGGPSMVFIELTRLRVQLDINDVSCAGMLIIMVSMKFGLLLKSPGYRT